MNNIEIRRRETGNIRIPGINPVLGRVYTGRGLKSVPDLRLASLPHFETMMNIRDAADRLAYAIDHDQRICIAGDFDADGCFSTALLFIGLGMLGAKRVQYRVPDRVRLGYGLTPGLVEEIKQDCPDLIVTVDNGISAIEGVRQARSLGIDVLVTDHHLAGSELPDALIVNPNQPGDQFPSKALCGAGVAFYVLLALRSHMVTKGRFSRRDAPNLAQLLPMVAIATAADVVPFDETNRILVSAGVTRIRAGQFTPGIGALLQLADRSPATITAQDLAWSIAPRINSAGRLEDMTIGIECVSSSDHNRACKLAELLNKINLERRDIEKRMRKDALDMLEEVDIDMPDRENSPLAVTLHGVNWHQGVVGLVAGKVKEKLYKPVAAFAPSGNDDNILKGSVRSIPGVNIRDALALVHARHPDLIIGFGGHAMAAGLSLREEAIDAFRSAFDKAIYDITPNPDELFAPYLLSDGELSSDDMNLDMAVELRDGGPWGQGFSEPIFDGAFKVARSRLLGEEGNHLSMDLVTGQNGQTMRAIAFFHHEMGLSDAPSMVKTAYQLQVNEFRGKTSAQMILRTCEEMGP